MQQEFQGGTAVDLLHPNPFQQAISQHVERSWVARRGAVLLLLVLLLITLLLLLALLLHGKSRFTRSDSVRNQATTVAATAAAATVAVYEGRAGRKHSFGEEQRSFCLVFRRSSVARVGRHCELIQSLWVGAAVSSFPVDTLILTPCPSPPLDRFNFRL
jgi:hypothetical protein